MNQGLIVRDDTLGKGQGLVVEPGIDPRHEPASYLITPDLGERVGANLFHSFLEFSIGAGETATFTGRGQQRVENVISRVTGGNPSDINGTLRSTIEGANLYLLNPSGILFGPQASLDVDGSFHASTANYLRFGEEFFEAMPSGAVPMLAVAAPDAFGFLDQAPAPILVDGSVLRVSQPNALSLVGSDLTIKGAELHAPAGAINLFSVAAPGEVLISATSDALILDLDSFSRLGTITLESGALLDVSAVISDLVFDDEDPFDQGGVVRVRGANFIVRDSTVDASAEVIPEFGFGLVLRDGVDVQLTGELRVSASQLIAQFIGGGGGPSIKLSAPLVILEAESDVATGLVFNFDAAFVGLDSAGSVVIEAESLRMSGGSQVSTSADASAFIDPNGAAGDVSITAGEVSISGRSASGRHTGIAASALPGTAQGSIQLDVGRA